jgi:flagellar protein FlaG
MMMNEISQKVVVIVSPQAKGRSGSVSPVREAPAVESSKITNSTKELRVEPQSKQAVNEKDVEEAVVKLNDYAQSVNRQLQFSVDEDSGKTIVKVIDAETGETIRDIPPEEILEMQNRLREISERFMKKEDAGVSLLFQGKA